MDTFEVSQHRACAVIGQPRSTKRLPPTAPTEPEQHLRARLCQVTQEDHPYGYLRLQALLVREGHVLNHKPI